MANVMATVYGDGNFLSCLAEVLLLNIYVGNLMPNVAVGMATVADVWHFDCW